MIAPQLTSCSAARGSKRKREKKRKKGKAHQSIRVDVKKWLRHFYAGSTMRALKKKREREREGKRKGEEKQTRNTI